MRADTTYTARLQYLLTELMAQHSLPCYRIEAIPRQQGDSATPVLRIVTYFEDTVSKVAHVLQAELDLEIISSVSKNDTWLDSFSSAQVYYLCTLKANRAQLAEYKRHAATRFEVRICTMLQDAWTGMETELKAHAGNIPVEVRRDFYRVGAFLEMADIEFTKIKALLADKNASSGVNGNATTTAATYEVPQPSYATPTPAVQEEPIAASGNSHWYIDDEAGDEIPAPEHSELTATDEEAMPVYGHEEVTHNHYTAPHEAAEPETNDSAWNSEQAEDDSPEPVHYAQMTDATLKGYVITSSVLKETDQLIAAHAGATINAEADIEGDVERLRFLEVYTIDQLHQLLGRHKHEIAAFAAQWIGSDNGGTFDSGICLFYLEYLLVGQRNDQAFAVDYVLRFISDNDYSARYIIPTYNAISRQAQPADVVQYAV